MNDIIVFSVGLVVSILVVFGMFSRVVLEMRDAKNQDVSAAKGEDQASGEGVTESSRDTKPYAE